MAISRKGRLTCVHDYPNTCPRWLCSPRWLTVEKSPAIGMRTNAHVTRRDEGVPPYRRLRRESYTIVISSVSREIPRGRNENNRTRTPKYLPAGARRPRGISPLRSGLNLHFGRNDIIKPSGRTRASAPYKIGRNDIVT